MKPEDSHQDNAQTKPKPKKRQPVKKGDPHAERMAATFVILGCLAAGASGVLIYYRRDTPLVWASFSMIEFFLIAIHFHWRNQLVKGFCVVAGVAAFLGCLYWQYRLLPKSELTDPLKMPQLQSFEATPQPSVSPSASPIGTPETRVFLDIDPEKLLDFFERYNEAQAEDLVKPYIGKWIETSGVVISVTNETIFPKGSKTPEQIIHGITVGLKSQGKKKRSPEGSTRAEFDEQRWIDRARVLRPFKDTVKVRGQIRYIFSYGFYLEHGEIIE